MANFLGRLQTFLFGAAIGRAASESITPVLEPVRQHAWQQNQLRVLDPTTAAEARAKGIISEGDAEDEASRNGISSQRFGALLRLAQDYPGSGELMRMLNRQKIAPGDVEEALTRRGIPQKFHGPITELFAEILTPGELAAAVHRGLVPSDGILLGEQPSGPRKVESYPVFQIDPLVEAAGSGLDEDRLRVLVGLQGLPMGTHEAAQAFFRGIITHGDYIAAFNESNSRNEWAQAVLDQTRQIPTARDFFENALRGYHDLAWAQQQAERHGMSPDDSLVIYQNQGRPMNLRAITQALARGGVFKPEPGELQDPFMASIVEGNLKPAYYDLAFANRYTLPSAFVMRQLAETGVWSEAKTAERLKWSGWFPDDADEVAKAWAGGGGGVAVDANVKKAETHLWTTTHASYKGEMIGADAARQRLTTLGIAAAAQDRILALWDSERSLIRAQLSPLQVKKAYVEQVINPATGAKWTEQDATTALLERGYTQNDATTLLHE